MTLLKDDEIVVRVTGGRPILTGLAQPANWYSENSPIQPSSVDLPSAIDFFPEWIRTLPAVYRGQK